MCEGVVFFVVVLLVVVTVFVLLLISKSLDLKVTGGGENGSLYSSGISLGSCI